MDKKKRIPPHILETDIHCDHCESDSTFSFQLCCFESKQDYPITHIIEKEMKCCGCDSIKKISIKIKQF